MVKNIKHRLNKHRNDNEYHDIVFFDLTNPKVFVDCRDLHFLLNNDPDDDLDLEEVVQRASEIDN